MSIIVFLKKGTRLGLMSVLCFTTTLIFSQWSYSENVRGVTDTTIKIGMIADMTGPGTSVTGILGELLRNYTSYINERGGIHGRKVVSLLEDDRLSIPLGIAAFKKLIFRDKVFAILGPANTPSAKALFSKVEKHKVPNIALIPQEVVVNPLKRYIFMTVETYDDDFGVIFDYLVNERNAKDMKIAFVTYDGESGKEAWGYVKKWAQFFNHKHPIQKEIIPLGALESSSQVMSIKRKGITHILIHHMVANGALLLRELRKFGMSIPVYADLLSCSDDVVKLAGDSAKDYIGTHAFSSWYDDTPGMQELREITLKYHPGTEKPWRSKYYTFGWVAMSLLREGMLRAGKNLTPESCVKGLESITNFDTQGLCGPISFSPKDHKAFSSCRLYKADPPTGKLLPISDWRNPPKF
ncbi:MAG: ABC transporter substrate-binding protein [Thermodesulfobacteriota bacterium]|nr:ABC transporter substrate-binding protein [Thermodesulfobacteriota bacterium]